MYFIATHQNASHEKMRECEMTISSTGVWTRYIVGRRKRRRHRNNAVMPISVGSVVEAHPSAKGKFVFRQLLRRYRDQLDIVVNQVLRVLRVIIRNLNTVERVRGLR